MMHALPQANGLLSIRPPLQIRKTCCHAAGIFRSSVLTVSSIALALAGLANSFGACLFRARKSDKDRLRSGARGGFGWALCSAQTLASHSRSRADRSPDNKGYARTH